MIFACDERSITECQQHRRQHRGLSDSPPCAALLLLAGIRGSTVAILSQARALPQKQSLTCDNPCIMFKPVATHLMRRSKSGGTSPACSSR